MELELMMDQEVALEEERARIIASVVNDLISDVVATVDTIWDGQRTHWIIELSGEVRAICTTEEGVWRTIGIEVDL